MRFNGIDLMDVHPAISRCKDLPPGLARRSVTSVSTGRRDLVLGVNLEPDEYTVRVNIAARSYKEAMEACDRLAEWAAGSGNTTGWLEPTHMPGRAYRAIVKSVSRIEERFGTVDVVFALPDPVKYGSMEQSHEATDRDLVMMAAGTAEMQPVITFAAKEAAEGLEIVKDGKPLIAITGAVNAGDVMEVTLETGKVLVNGEDAGSRVDYTKTDFDAGFGKGRHVLSANRSGTLKARWRDAWQ